MNLDNILSRPGQKALSRNDNTIAHKKKLYQIEEPVKGGKVMSRRTLTARCALHIKGKA